MEFLRRLFCRHTFKFDRNIYGDEIIERGWKRSLWRCSKCGASTARNELHSARAEKEAMNRAYLEAETLLDSAATEAARKFCGVGELERTGYIPAGSADERET